MVATTACHAIILVSPSVSLSTMNCSFHLPAEASITIDRNDCPHSLHCYRDRLFQVVPKVGQVVPVRHYPETTAFAFTSCTVFTVLLMILSREQHGVVACGKSTLFTVN